jgi:hypothetical protein
MPFPNGLNFTNIKKILSFKEFKQTLHKFVANINRTILISGKLKRKITTEFLKWDLVLFNITH